MDWKFFWITFGSIFMAELGDKTQLAVLSFSAEGRSPRTVFAAASLGLVASTFIGVVAGNLLGKVISPSVLKMLGGALFIGLGFWMIFGKD